MKGQPPASLGSAAVDVAPQKAQRDSATCPTRCFCVIPAALRPQAPLMVLGFLIISRPIVAGGDRPFCLSRHSRPPAVAQGATRALIDTPVGTQHENMPARGARTLNALVSHPPPAVGSERPTLATWAVVLNCMNTIPLGTGALDEWDSAGLFVAPGTSTCCLTPTGKPTALMSADVDILQGNCLIARCSRAICSSGDDDIARRPDTALLPSAAYDRARRAGGSTRDDAAIRGIRTERPRAIGVHRSTPLSLYVCFKTNNNHCVPQDSRGLFVAPEISTRRGDSASEETNVRQKHFEPLGTAFVAAPGSSLAQEMAYSWVSTATRVAGRTARAGSPKLPIVRITNWGSNHTADVLEL
ncbi:hypothetical protein VTO73DRAFT_10015 [Trametes versicolor]